MLFTIAIILLILWLLGAFVFPVGGGLIHILLVIALIVIVSRLLTGRKVVWVEGEGFDEGPLARRAALRRSSRR